jgi:putative acetyltransferase
MISTPPKDIALPSTLLPSRETDTDPVTILRPFQPADEPDIVAIILQVSDEFGADGPGYYPGDPDLDQLHRFFSRPGYGYWVAEDVETGQLLGGAGFAPLKGARPEDAICELQKVYLLPQARGRGIGLGLVQLAKRQARVAGYKEMYIETFTVLERARQLYLRCGFTVLDGHKGDTGYQDRCNVFMSQMLPAK